MEERQDDGGPAFARSGFEADPSEKSTFDTPPQKGMSLRDWFAGQALAGIVCGTQAEKMKPTGPGEAAHWAYAIADAMIAARKQ